MERRLARITGQPVRKLRRAPRPRFPLSAERVYKRRLIKLVQGMRAIYEILLIPRLETLTQMSRALAPRVIDAWPGDLAAILSLIRTTIDRNYSRAQLEGLAREQGMDISTINRRDMTRVLAVVGGVDFFNSENWLPAKIDAFTQENVSLISSIPEKVHAEVEQLVIRNVRNGERWETTKAEILERFDVAESRAALIARDQTAKFNGDLNKSRQTQAGIRSYRWATSMDERVRGRPGGLYPDADPSHWAHEGKIYEWDNPPADTGHPGEDYQCRCVPIPVFPGESDSGEGS